MSIRFAIKPYSGKAEKEGNEIVRYSGVAEPFNQKSERQVKKVGVDGGGNPRFVFTTGLDEEKVDLYHWYDEEEKVIVREQIKELKPIIAKAYGGVEVLENNNKYFWRDNTDVYVLKVNNATSDMFFDTKNPSHALLYLSVISGAFVDTVAPTKEFAGKYQVPHYLHLEGETADYSDEADITRSDAHVALGKLRLEQPDALFYLGWALQADTTSFGGYLKSTPMKTLIKYHIDYIDGKLQTKKKRNCPALFKEYADKWEKQQTRDRIITEAYVRAGEHYALINQKEKKFVLSNGTVLGNTVAEAVATLYKPKFQQDYEMLRDAVEAKWKE